jgi:hypothetical protein
MKFLLIREIIVRTGMRKSKDSVYSKCLPEPERLYPTLRIRVNSKGQREATVQGIRMI